jgi:hypothetical protein
MRTFNASVALLYGPYFNVNVAAINEKAAQYVGSPNSLIAGTPSTQLSDSRDVSQGWLTKRQGIYANIRAIKHVPEIKIVHMYIPTEGGVYVA